nr:MAG TPA: hypothetical protein [Bacteriophage sp.]
MFHCLRFLQYNFFLFITFSSTVICLFGNKLLYHIKRYINI